MRRPRERTAWVVFRAFELGGGFVFFSVILHHVYNFDFKPLAALCLPILVVFFAFASLLYSRGRAFAKGNAQVRSLYAAERAMQGSVWVSVWHSPRYDALRILVVLRRFV